MTGQPLSIIGSGMVTGVGLSAPAACAAIRCGIANFQETRFKDSAGEWIVASEVQLSKPWRGFEKLGRMLAAVIEETFRTDADLVPSEIPLLICLPERERPGRLDGHNGYVLDVAQKLLDFDIHHSSITVSQGRVGAAVALREARKMVYEERFPAVVVAGVDSFLSPRTLLALEESGRLLTSDNSNGFIPADGASAIIVKRPEASAERQLIMTGLGFGVEEATIESETPLRAIGLVAAIKESLADARVGMEAIDYRITDVSGEQFSFKEASLAVARTLRVLKEEFDIWHAADCVGETGSVAGLIALNVAWHACKNGYADGDTVLCHFGNDDGKRAAAILSYQPVVARGQ